MKNGLLLTTIVLAISGAAGFAVQVRNTQDPVVPIPVQVEPRRPRSQQIDNLMEQKLDHAEVILKGLVTHDFDAIERAAEDLKLMSLDPPKGWKKTDSDEDVYEHFRMEFMRLAARLEQEAKDKHLSGVAWFQQQMTATCIACHDYIRDEEIK
ncbi:MAG: hypothetical protein JNM43_05420 [Planctomycetaceae bacterium]|nr:hypothetical protein [Planctomycetaceae bacterium]